VRLAKFSREREKLGVPRRLESKEIPFVRHYGVTERARGVYRVCNTRYMGKLGTL